MQSVNVIGHGTLNFPDDMTQDQMAEAIQRNFPDIHPQDSAQSSASDVPLVPGMQGYEQQQAAQQAQYANNPATQPRSFIDKAGSALTAGGVMLGNAIPATIGAIGGSAYGLISGQGEEEMARGAEQFSPLSTSDPLANEYMQKTGEFLGAFDPGFVGRVGLAASSPARLARDKATLQGAGQAIKQEASLVPKSVSDISNAVNKTVDEAKTGSMKLYEPEILKIDDKAARIKAGSTENDLAPYKLEGDKVVADPHAKAAISQGWEDGTVQRIKTMDPQTTDAAKQMLNIAEQGRKDSTFRDQNSPTDVIGDALEQNINFLKKKNTDSGKAIDSIAESLPNEPMDVSAPINKFINELETKADIKFPRDENGNVIIGKDNKITPNYDGSILEGDLYKSDRDFLQKTLNRLTNTGSPTPLNVHRAKRYIDDSVTWGKGNQSTVRPEIERAAKSLRVGLDDALDQKFPEYDKANTQYKDTVTALDGLQDSAGKKLDFFAEGANKQLGTLSRRLMQNVTSRQELQNAITKLQDTSLKYGNPKTVDINRLGSFGADLEKVYKNSKPYSFQTQTALGAARAAHGDVSGAVHVLGAAKDFALRRTPEKQFNSMSSLIEQQRIKHIRSKQNPTELQSTDMVTQ